MLWHKCLILLHSPFVNYMSLCFFSIHTSNKIIYLILIIVCVAFSNCAKKEEAGVEKEFLVKYHNQAVTLRGSNDINRAIRYVDSVHNAVKEFSRPQRWQKHNFKIDIYLNRASDLKKARITIDSMYSILEGIEEKYPEMYIYTKFFEGDLLLRGANYNAGLIKYYEAENFGRTHLTPCAMSVFTNKIALIKYRQKRYAEAIPYFKKSLNELSTCAEMDDFGKRILNPQSSLNTIGLCFEKIGMLDSAIVYYKKGIALINQRKTDFPKHTKGITTALAVFYGNLGGTYLLNGDNILAESLLKESIKINHKRGFEIMDAHSAELKLADLYIKTNRLTEAKVLLNSLTEEINNWKHPYNNSEQQLLLRFKELNWKLLDRSKDVPAAYTAFKDYSLLKDSLGNLEKSINEKDLESVFKIAKNEYELELLNKSNKLTTIYMWSAIISSTFLIVILVLIITYLKRYKRHNLSLKKLNQEVSEKNGQLENALSALQKSHEDNYRMMKIIYHDLRSPIGGMTMAIGLMLEDEHHTTEDREMLQMINTSGQDAIGLINDMLQINTDVELAKENIKLDELLQYCSAMLQYKAEEKGQIIQSISEPIDIEIDQEKIRRVLNNLLSNAIKFSPFQSKIILSGIKQGSNILISCEDFGIGVPEDQLETIFDMFTEAKRMGTMGEVTFGMGLAICRQIVNAHKGQIWCENKIEGGSIFKILLPLNIN
ncbi:MAG: hypothetical protein EOO87_04065 [Pedobacter sp.]|nr:MAG: hypothetical protein EOO87_04065 [Pedobacter sp.]